MGRGARVPPTRRPQNADESVDSIDTTSEQSQESADISMGDGEDFDEMFGDDAFIDLDEEAQAFDKIDGDQVLKMQKKAQPVVGFNVEKTRETNGA